MYGELTETNHILTREVEHLVLSSQRRQCGEYTNYTQQYPRSGSKLIPWSCEAAAETVAMPTIQGCADL